MVGAVMKKKHFYALVASHFNMDMNSASITALLPMFVTKYGMHYAAIAGLTFASALVSSIVQPISGILVDKGPRQWFMSLGLVLCGVGLAAVGFDHDYRAIFAAIVIMSIGGAIFHPEAAREVHVVSGKNKGKGMSIFDVGGNVGRSLAPMLVVMLVAHYGMHGLSVYCLMSCLMAALMLVMAGGFSEAIDGDATETVHEATATRETPQAGCNDWWGFGRLFLVIMFRSTIFTAIYSFLPLFCMKDLGASETMGSMTLSILSGAGVLAALAGGWISDRCGYIRTLHYAGWLLVPCLAVIALSHSIWPVFLILLPLSMALQGTYSSFVVLGQSYLAKNIGFASGITMGVSFSIGGLIAPLLGTFADTYGLEDVMLILVGLSIIVALAGCLLKPPKIQKV